VVLPGTNTYPFPIEGQIEQLLYELLPLTDINLQCKEEKYKTTFNHLVGKSMHVTAISHPDFSCACMRFSVCMACSNEPIFLPFITFFVIYSITPNYQLCILTSHPLPLAATLTHFVLRVKQNS
jgi:hypothetical protein